MDRAVIFTEITRRNAARRRACLPLLDVREKSDRAVALAVEQEIEALEHHPTERGHPSDEDARENKG